MTGVLGGSARGSYAWLRRRRSARWLSDDDLLREVHRLWLAGITYAPAGQGVL